MLGVSVLLGGTNPDQLPEQILDRLRALTEGQSGQSERFEHLTDGQRHALHVVAEEWGLEHRSEGKKGTPQRKLILTLPKHWKKPQSGPKWTKTVVKDPRKFAALFGDIPGVQVHGRLTRGGVTWEPGAAIPPVLERLITNSERNGWQSSDRLALVLRGFPGSGKSTLAAYLRRQVPLDTASADDFVTESDCTADAHKQCHEVFLQAIKSNRSVIVDNTNVSLSEYAFYRERAGAAGYTVVVLEIVCASTTELELFRKRSVHKVPGQAVGAMHRRWEHDPAALRILPCVPQELLPWLREQNMLERPPHTHLVMPKGPFISVPLRARAEFLERFASEWGRNYISELASPEAFRLFFDIDNLSFDKLLPALKPLRALVGAPLVLTGTTDPPSPGYHICVPARTVDTATAFALRRQWLDAVPDLESHVDSQLYQSPQLRMVGSRKISKDGVDMGRVHQVVGCFDEDWQPDFQWKWSDVSIQR